MNGGIGFALNEPQGILKYKPSKHFEFIDHRVSSFTRNEQRQLTTIIDNTCSSLKLEHCISVELEGGILTHHGMGSGTAVRLACLEALLSLNNIHCSEEELITCSGRGGTSGIGIHTYFQGGLVFDLGAKNRGTNFVPSSQAKKPEPPMPLNSISMPAWNIGLCIPKNIRAKTQQEEKEFFNKTCPISEKESYKTLYHCLFGIYAAVRAGDLECFTKGIRSIQQCEWKRKERAEYGSALEKIEEKLYGLGADCVGMSSLGPLLFFIAPDHLYHDIIENIQEYDCYALTTSCANTGRKVV